MVCINNSSTSLKITAYVTLCGCYGYQPLWHPVQCRPDLAATVIVRGRHSIETLPCKLGPIIVSVHHLPHLPVIVALDRTNGWDEWRRGGGGEREREGGRRRRKGGRGGGGGGRERKIGTTGGTEKMVFLTFLYSSLPTLCSASTSAGLFWGVTMDPADSSLSVTFPNTVLLMSMLLGRPGDWS